MKNLFVYNILILGISLGLRSMAYADSCPTPPNKVKADVKVKTSYNPTLGLYTYDYQITTARDSQLDLDQFSLRLEENPQNIKQPQKWINAFNTYQVSPNKFVWGGVLDSVKRGQTKTGFSFQSGKPPGPVIYSIQGDSELPTVTATPENREPELECPGFALGEDQLGNEEDIIGITQGPVSANVISGELKIDDKVSRPKKHPRDLGKMFVVLLGSDKLDVKKVDIASLKFGYGEASPVSSRVISGFRGCSHLKDDKNKKENLLLEFDLAEVQIRCDLDLALLLTGTVDGKKLFAGAEIEPVPCDKDLWKWQKKRWNEWKEKKQKKKNHRH